MALKFGVRSKFCSFKNFHGFDSAPEISKGEEFCPFYNKFRRFINSINQKTEKRFLQLNRFLEALISDVAEATRKQTHCFLNGKRN